MSKIYSASHWRTTVNYWISAIIYVTFPTGSRDSREDGGLIPKETFTIRPENNRGCGLGGNSDACVPALERAALRIILDGRPDLLLKSGLNGGLACRGQCLTYEGGAGWEPRSWVAWQPVVKKERHRRASGARNP